MNAMPCSPNVTFYS